MNANNAQIISHPLTIMPATSGDIAQIIALARRIWPEAYATILTPEQIANMLERIYTLENLRKEMENGHRFWIAQYEGQPAGYMSSYKDGDIIWLKKIYVTPSVQGKGIGTQLIDTAIAAWAPAHEIRLYVNPNNLPAHRFYERAGFTNIGTMPVQMGDFAFCDLVFARQVP